VTVLTDEQIERRVEKATDRLDARFMAGRISQNTYDAAQRGLAAWAAERYNEYARFLRATGRGG
jgi:hypothetical protein